MKKHAIAILFGLIFSAACLSAQAPWLKWRSQYHDTMLVPPNAQNVSFTERGTQDELTYTVAEPYPATDFIDGLCEELRLKGWEPSGQDDCLKPKWTKISGAPRDQYELVLNWTKWDNDSRGWVPASYDMKYTNAEDEQDRSILHVDTFAGNRVTSPGPETAHHHWPVLSHRMSVFAALLLYLLVLAAIVWLVTITKVRDAVFYSGPSAWRTWINLALFSPAAGSFLSIGLLLIAALLPAGKDGEGQGALVVFVYIWIILAFCAAAGAVASPVVVVITGTIVFAESIPRKVKIAHAVFGLLSLSFWVLCIVSFSRPLIRW